MFSKGNWMTQYQKTEKGTYVKRQKQKIGSKITS